LTDINNINTGSLYFVNLNDATGHEQSKTRPAVAISKHLETGLVAIIPFTSQINAERFPYIIKIKKSTNNGLTIDSIGLIFQIRSIHVKRFINLIGILEDKYMCNIKKELSLFLNIS